MSATFEGLETRRDLALEGPHPWLGGNGEGSNGLQEALGLWKLLADIADYQGKIWLNWHQWWPEFVLAPAKNCQEILSGWVIGRQVNIYKSSDPALEEFIRSNIAGYGSQLGTILDYLECVQKKLELPLEPQNANGPVHNLETLIDQVKAAKKLAKAKRLPAPN